MQSPKIPQMPPSPRRFCLGAQSIQRVSWNVIPSARYLWKVMEVSFTRDLPNRKKLKKYQLREHPQYLDWENLLILAADRLIQCPQGAWDLEEDEVRSFVTRPE